MVPRAGQAFDAEGNLTDERVREHLTSYLTAFVAHVAG
jgi:hypothetical protein